MNLAILCSLRFYIILELSVLLSGKSWSPLELLLIPLASWRLLGEVGKLDSSDLVMGLDNPADLVVILLVNQEGDEDHCHLEQRKLEFTLYLLKVVSLGGLVGSICTGKNQKGHRCEQGTDNVEGGGQVSMGAEIPVGRLRLRVLEATEHGVRSISSRECKRRRIIQDEKADNDDAKRSTFDHRPRVADFLS